MKKFNFSLILLFLVFTISGYAQSRKESQATVEKIMNVPIFVYSYPTSEFEEKEDVTATWSLIASALDENASVADKAKELIQTAKNKKKKGKVSEFDALLINPDDYSGTLIKFAGEKSLNADVKRVLGVPVYLFSYPNDEYEEVGEITATMSLLLGSDKLSDQTSELVAKAKKKEKKKKVGKFDAIIISPDDFTGILIKFK
jgi:hypothetical protein